MRYLLLIVGFAVIVHVKCQLSAQIEDILYGEDEEDDEVAATTTARARRRRTTTEAPAPPPAPVVVNVRQRQEAVGGAVPASATNPGNGTAPATNHTFLGRPSDFNNSFFGNIVQSSAGTGVTTERVHYVLGQVGNIWNNVGALNITGIVDQALGIRNSQIARPLVTGILNVIFCNPLAFSENNCNRRRN